jgi:hypothetical protein
VTGKGKKMDSPYSLQKESSSAQPQFQPSEAVLDFDFQELQDQNAELFMALNL